MARGFLMDEGHLVPARWFVSANLDRLAQPVKLRSVWGVYTGCMEFRFAYIAGDTPVHRCDARAKVIALLVFSIMVLLPLPWWAVLALSAVPWVLAALARIPARVLLVPLGPVLVLAIFAAGFSVFYNPGPAGVLNGAVVAMRMVALVVASFVVCMTADATDLLRAFAFFMEPLRRLRVPVDDIAFTLVLALRFIPLIAGQFREVRLAQRARGADGRGLGPYRRAQVWGAAFSAVFVGLFRQADATATAMDARCYGAAERRTSLRG